MSKKAVIPCVIWIVFLILILIVIPVNQSKAKEAASIDQYTHSDGDSIIDGVDPFPTIDNYVLTVFLGIFGTPLIGCYGWTLEKMIRQGLLSKKIGILCVAWILFLVLLLIVIPVSQSKGISSDNLIYIWDLDVDGIWDTPSIDLFPTMNNYILTLFLAIFTTPLIGCFGSTLERITR